MHRLNNIITYYLFKRTKVQLNIFKKADRPVRTATFEIVQSLIRSWAHSYSLLDDSVRYVRYEMFF